MVPTSLPGACAIATVYRDADRAFIVAARTLLPLALDAIEERDAEIVRLRARLDAGDEPHPLECPACGDDVNRCHCMNELYVRRANERAAWPDPGEQVVS